LLKLLLIVPFKCNNRCNVPVSYAMSLSIVCGQFHKQLVAGAALTDPYSAS